MVWLRRLLSRNPLVRSIDRIESAALVLVFALGVLAVPIAGAAGTAAYDGLVHDYAARRLTQHQIDATVLEDSRPLRTVEKKGPFVSPVEWEFGGTVHTDEVRTDGLRAGDTVAIWGDDTGARTAETPSDGDAAAQAVVAVVTVWSGVVGVGVVAWLLLRVRCNHLRSRFWERELSSIANDHSDREDG